MVQDSSIVDSFASGRSLGLVGHHRSMGNASTPRKEQFTAGCEGQRAILNHSIQFDRTKVRFLRSRKTFDWSESHSLAAFLWL